MAYGALIINTTEGLIRAQVTGSALHSCLYLPFGRLDHPEDWFPAQTFGDIKLKLTGESSLGVTKVLTQQLRA